MRTPEQIDDNFSKTLSKREDIIPYFDEKKQPIIPSFPIRKNIINPYNLEDPNTPENPNGYVRIRVSQPGLLYLLAREEIPPKGSPTVYLNEVNLADNLFSSELSMLRPPSDLRKNQYSLDTTLFLSENQKSKPEKGYYTPQRVNQVKENLQAQGIDLSTDDLINGQNRIKIYSQNGDYGVEVLLGWSSEQGYIDWQNQNFSLMASKFGKLYNKEDAEDDFAMYESKRGVSIHICNKNRLDSGAGTNIDSQIPATEQEFREQMEFYRSTLEQVLIALYKEAGVTPKVDITLRPPVRSEDKIEELRSISSEVVTPVTPEQIFPERVTLNDIKGQPNAVREARRLVRAINEPEIYERRGIKPPKGILLVGPPGTGKTMIAKGIASEADAEFLPINAAEVGSKFINESAQLMNKVFEQAEKLVRQGKRVILFLDEVDALASLREGAHREDIKTISILLQRLDGMATIPGITLLATTNRLSALDPAIIRPGRIDKIVNVELPNEEGRKETLSSYLEKARRKARDGGSLFSDNLDVEVVARATEGMSQAELENLINRALELKLDDELEGRGWNPVTDTDLINMIPLVKNEFGQKSQMKKQSLGFRTTGY